MKKFLFTIGLCLTLAISLAIPSAAKEAPAEASAAANSIHAEETVTEENPFLALYDDLTEHLPELFSALSLLGAAIIAFCYKRGLLPLLKDGIGTIGAAALDCGKKAESYAAEGRSLCEKANDSIHFTTNYMKKIEESLVLLDEKISAFGEQKKEGRLLHMLMEKQIDMLQEIFLASSLPQFEKDRVCKHVEEMRLALKAAEETKEESENA